MATESYEPSYYAILGVPEDAPPELVGRAFMRAMREAHPDAHAADPGPARQAAEERARLLTEAHGVLTGPDRAGYDARLGAYRGAGAPDPEAVLPPGASSETVLALSRDRWLRGGRLTPSAGGAPIEIPPRVPAGEVLVFPGRGAPDREGRAGDLSVRVVHVDRDGTELAGGHRSLPGSVALAALAVLVAVAAGIVLLLA